MLPDSSTSVTHREEWFGPEDVPKEILLYFISIPQVLEWFCSYKKIVQEGCTHFPVISNGFNKVNVKITSWFRNYLIF